MLREEDITIQIKSQGYECKTYTANVEGTEAVLLFESRQRTADMRCCSFAALISSINFSFSFVVIQINRPFIVRGLSPRLGGRPTGERVAGL